MPDDLLDLAIATAGGHELWNGLRALKIDISIGGPLWAMKTRTLHVTGTSNHVNVQPWKNTTMIFPRSLRLGADA